MKQAQMPSGMFNVAYSLVQKCSLSSLIFQSTILYHILSKHTCVGSGAIDSNPWPVSGAQTQNGRYTSCSLQHNDIR